MSYTVVEYHETLRPLVALYLHHQPEGRALARVIIGAALVRDLGSKDQINLAVPVTPEGLDAEQVFGGVDEDEVRAGLPDLVIQSFDLYGQIESAEDVVPVVRDHDGSWVVER